MRDVTLSRRMILGAGTYAMVAATSASEALGAHPKSPLSAANEAVVRRYYAAWEAKKWTSMDALLADDFTFASPLDEPMNKTDFKKNCWDTQIAFIERFDLRQVVGADDAAFVMYTCHTMNGKTFKNVEFLQLHERKLRSVVCYFGGRSSFPSAVSAEKS